MKSGPRKSASQDADFAELYQLYSREVWALAYARWLDAHLAMDLTQEAFLRLWKQRASGEEILNPRAWLLRVTRNLAEDHAKSAFHRNGTQSPQIMDGIRSRGLGPSERLEREEAFAKVRGALKHLAQPDREILTLRYALDYDTDQIAKTLAITITAVHMRLSRARQRLAEHLAAEGACQIP